MTVIARAAARLAPTIAIILLTLTGTTGAAVAQTSPPTCTPLPTCLVLPEGEEPPPRPSLDDPPPAPNGPPPLPLPTEVGDQLHTAGMDGLFSINDGYGRTLHHYDLFANLPWLLDNPVPTIWLWLANIGFAVGKYTLGFAVWFTEWAMGSQVLTWIQEPAQQLERIWQADIIGALKLRQLVLLAATCYLGLLFFRGRTTRAWREMISTIAINVLAIAIITHPVDLLVGDGGVLSLSRDLGADVAAVVMGRQPAGTGNPAAPIGQSLIDNLLITPWETLNYGAPITQDREVDGGCQHSVEQVLDQGPWSSKDDSTPARELDGCPGDYGKYNEVAGADRAVGAWLYAVAMILFAILTVCLNAIQVLAPYFLLFEGLLLSLALIAALVPAWQHQLAYRISSIAITLATLLMGMLFIAVMTILLRSVMLIDLGSQLVRFAVIDIVVFSGFLFRKRLLAGAQRMRAKVNTGLQRAGRRGRPLKPLPTPIVPPGPNRLGRTIQVGTTAFREAAVQPAQQVAGRLRTAGKTAGKLGSTALAYTAGAPVAWPRAARRAHTALTRRGNTAKRALAGKSATAKTYTTTYARNLGTATGARPAWNAARTVATAVTARPPARHAAQQTPATAQPATGAARLADLTPHPTAATPRFRGRNEAAPAPRQPDPGALPPGMLPPPNPLAQRLRDRLDHRRGTRP
ncbi:hypothetical protein [Amycolatopsis aidingensis]|uniref:hypothetical protein n=1 Tax=Amycolatopsis aidingensis TaxID=2842453 RepID=UPI001C0C4CDA|nr:hypothetical protein [Amycolatopsis aidingensis]